MNISNYYWWFKSAIPPKICDDIIRYGLSKKESIAKTGGYDNKELTKEDIKDLLGKAEAVGDFLGTTTAQGMNAVTNMVPGGLTPTVADFTEYDPGEEYGSGGEYDEFGTGV